MAKQIDEREAERGVELVTTVAKSARRGLGEAPTSVPPLVHAAPGSLRPGPEERYAFRMSLGEGGMGVVELFTDRWIGRDVAFKTARLRKRGGSEGRGRFLREVRIQGQLEHPGVVPVYDLSETAEGLPTFSMKRVRGQTLAEVIEGLAKGDERITEAMTLRRRLTVLSQACLTIAFAHSRGVVHRDLKPSNIMIGDFGEVYVLDWGVAKLRAREADEDGPATEAGPHSAVPQSDDGLGKTADGAVLGTPGYMSPEQVRGEQSDIGPAADLYALGLILYELLAYEPLHKGRSGVELMAYTLREDIDRKPSAVRPDVAPELDAICERALALEPQQRFGSARELSEALERFLDGARDEERRRLLAEGHVTEALATLEQASKEPERATDARSKAIYELSRALALDPNNLAARTALVRAFTISADELPPEAEQELLEVDRRDRVRSARRAAIAFSCAGILGPVLLWSGVRSWHHLLTMEACLLSVIIASAWMARTGNSTPQFMRFVIPLAFIMCASISVLFGPFVLVPAVTAAVAAVFLVSLRPNRLTRRYILICSVLALALPWFWRWIGLVPQAHRIENGVMTIFPRAIDYAEPATTIFLFAVGITTVVLTNWLIGRAAERLMIAERNVFAQAWMLRHLLPEDARGVGPSIPPSSRAASSRP